MQYDLVRKIKDLMDELVENANNKNFCIEKLFDEKETVYTGNGINSWLGLRGRFHLGLYRIKNDIIDYGVLLTNWRGEEEYYIILCDNTEQSSASLEIRKVIDNSFYWQYKPSKRDGKNALRKKLFSEVEGSCEVYFDIPDNAQEMEKLLYGMIKVAELRKHVHNLNNYSIR